MQAAASTAGNVVKHQWQLRSCGRNCAEMGLQPFLRRAVVVGHNHQGPMGTQGSGFAGGFHRFSGAVATRSGQNGHLLSHRIENGFDQRQLLIPTEGGGFTSRAANQ